MILKESGKVVLSTITAQLSNCAAAKAVKSRFRKDAEPRS
jgi:hypothetical protein